MVRFRSMTTTGKWWVIRHTHYAGKWWTGSDWSATRREHGQVYTDAERWDEARQAVLLPEHGEWEEC
jgi:hypothetical protein